MYFYFCTRELHGKCKIQYLDAAHDVNTSIK